MSNRRVSVEGLSNSDTIIAANVVVFEEREVEGQMQEVPLGEAQLSFPIDMSEEDMIERIKEAGKQIEERSDAAKELRAKLNEKLAEETGE